MPEPAPCVPACENSTATYLFNQDLSLAYDWMAVNGTVDFDPALPGQVTISWGPQGAASILRRQRQPDHYPGLVR